MSGIEIVDRRPPWVEWAGKGVPPIKAGQTVERRYRDGEEQSFVVREVHLPEWMWSHRGDTQDIVAYRIVCDVNGEADPMTPADQLRAAKALIDAPEKWTQQEFARNADGEPTILSRATCFCSLGALDYAGRFALEHEGAAEEALKAALPVRFMSSITAFNDDPGTTHSDIMALFDRAISLQIGGSVMTPHSLTDLISRVEAASGGNGRLSHEVLLAMGYDWNLDFGSSWYGQRGCKPSERIYVDKADVTRSLEAAMKLAPAGWRVRLEYGDNYACASFVKGYGNRKTIWGACTSERPDDEIALALVAACLRARTPDEKDQTNVDG